MIELKNLSKHFETADGSVDALRHINLTVQNGDIYGIIGMSGAGKSTLVRCINMLEKPTEGTVIWDGKDLGAMSEKELRAMRRQITMIFQSFNLLMQRTCLKNVTLPLRLSGMNKTDAEKRGMELLELVGLPDKANSYPAQLSGGQQQRVAIARALATEPEVLLCDEATNMQGPSKYLAISVSGVSGPKLPRKTTSALHPAALTSSTAFSMSASFSTVTGHSYISPG